MLDSQIKEKEYTKTTQYLLPLLGLHPSNFSNFINAYLDASHNHIIVLVGQKTQVEEAHPSLVMVMIHREDEEANEYAMYFKIDSMWETDVKRFLKGGYSYFSDAAKNKIYESPGAIKDVYETETLIRRHYSFAAGTVKRTKSQRKYTINQYFDSEEEFERIEEEYAKENKGRRLEYDSLPNLSIEIWE